MVHGVRWRGHRRHQMRAQHRHGLKVRQVLRNQVRAVIWVSEDLIRVQHNRYDCVSYHTDSATKTVTAFHQKHFQVIHHH